jgi:hypothetical protein
MNVVCMTVAAANLPPELQFESLPFVCHKKPMALFSSQGVVCGQDRQSREIPFREKTLGSTHSGKA